MRVKTGREVPALALMAVLVSACGGDKPVARSCDEHLEYLEAQEHRRVQVPEGLTPLDPEREMDMPEPSPQPPRPAGSPCLDLPPAVLSSDDADEDEEAEG